MSKVKGGGKLIFRLCIGVCWVKGQENQFKGQQTQAKTTSQPNKGEPRQVVGKNRIHTPIQPLLTRAHIPPRVGRSSIRLKLAIADSEDMHGIKLVDAQAVSQSVGDVVVDVVYLVDYLALERSGGRGGAAANFA